MRILLLGASGKVGCALHRSLSRHHEVKPVSSRDVDAADLDRVSDVVRSYSPDLVVNGIAFVGIDRCERDPGHAFKINALLPRRLAELSRRLGFILVHIGSEAVFDDSKRGGFYYEDDTPHPINAYGMTKFAGDYFVAGIAEKYYIARLGLVIGASSNNNQFFEKMLGLARSGRTPLQVASDIVCAPSCSLDAADAISALISGQSPFGLYHVVNDGRASLFDIMSLAMTVLRIDVDLEPVSHKHFPASGPRNTWTPMASRHIRLRPWQDAVRAYCVTLAEAETGIRTGSG